MAQQANQNSIPYATLGVNIARLMTDSRAVQAGDTFVAYPGEKMDGRQFIAQAIEQGANAVIWENQDFEWNPNWQVPNLGVADLRRRAGWLADAIYGQPSEKLWVVGVTGTNGKTSTSHWIAQALDDSNRRCALIGTLGNGFHGTLKTSANTTPDAICVHALLAEYVRVGAQALAMEVSSHALSQGRVNGVSFDIALLTNLSRDHFDYHGNMQNYAAAKRKLFYWHSLKYVVLNLDDAFGQELAEQLQDSAVEVIGYALRPLSKKLPQVERPGLRMVYGELLEMSGQGMKLAIKSSWGVAHINSSLVGRFNAENLLGALAVLLVSKIDLHAAALSLSKVQAVSGRMQRLGSAQQPTVIVDYAHSPDALEKVLLALREVSQFHSTAKGAEVNEQAIGDQLSSRSTSLSRLICVFGCGGERDRGKRGLMGKIAEQFSDHCIITSDNPRNEDPHNIIAEIVNGMSATKHEIIVERGAAIRLAISQARQSDTVLIAGKGHEDYQEVKGVRHPFNDVLIAQQALKVSHAEVCS